MVFFSFCLFWVQIQKVIVFPGSCVLYFISSASGGISLHHTEHCIGSRACTACQWVPQQGQDRRQGQVPVLEWIIKQKTNNSLSPCQSSFSSTFFSEIVWCFFLYGQCSVIMTYRFCSETLKFGCLIKYINSLTFKNLKNIFSVMQG